MFVLFSYGLFYILNFLLLGVGIEKSIHYTILLTFRHRSGSYFSLDKKIVLGPHATQNKQTNFIYSYKPNCNNYTVIFNIVHYFCKATLESYTSSWANVRRLNDSSNFYLVNPLKILEFSGVNFNN